MAIYGAVLSTLVYLRQRRQTRNVMWKVKTFAVEGSPHLGVNLTNRGIGRARMTTIDLDPSPDDGFDNTPRSVDLGATTSYTWMHPGWGATKPSRVTVHWRNRFGWPRSWSTEL